MITINNALLSGHAQQLPIQLLFPDWLISRQVTNGSHIYRNYLNNVPGHYLFKFVKTGTLFKAGTLFKVGHYSSVIFQFLMKLNLRK